MTESAASGLIRVNFSLRGFAKLMNQGSLSQETPEPAALQAFGRYLASLSLKADTPITFQSLPEFRGMDYMGYIIEKERLDDTTGTWVRLEEYRIMGNQACNYKDTRIAYGYTYRYRIRTVAKFTGYEPTVVSINNLQRSLSSVLLNALKSTANKNLPLAARLFPNGLQSKANTAASVKLTDNVSVTTDARGQPKFSYNLDDPKMQAVNSKAFTSLSKLQSALASTQPISTANLQSLVNGLQNYTPDTSSGKSYMSEYIVSYPSRNWQYVVAKNNTLPPPPQNIKVVPSSSEVLMRVYWLPPPDEQRDLESVNVYRRNAVGDPWALIAQDISLDQPMYVDTDIKLGVKYIYALQCTNLHGYKSFLSTQVQAELNPSYQFEKVEKPLVWISGPGARPDEPDTIFAAFYDSTEQLIAYNNIAISPSKVYNDTNSTVILKIRSLDTQETREMRINLNNVKYAEQ